MTATNHALTGAIIAASIVNPLVALPLAFLSHYVLDAIPHFGKDRAFLNSRAFQVMLIVDTLICFLLVLTLAITKVHHWPIIALGAFFAASPDFALINLYRHAKSNRLKDWHPSAYNRFAARIQWFEKPIGAVVEAVYCAAAIFILAAILAVQV